MTNQQASWIVLGLLARVGLMQKLLIGAGLFATGYIWTLHLLIVMAMQP